MDAWYMQQALFVLLPLRTRSPAPNGLISNTCYVMLSPLLLVITFNRKESDQAYAYGILSELISVTPCGLPTCVWGHLFYVIPSLANSYEFGLQTNAENASPAK